MISYDLDHKLNGLWHRAQNQPTLASLTPEVLVEWATLKNLTDAQATTRDVGAFHSTPCVVLETSGVKACFPRTPATGDYLFDCRRKEREDQALLWEKMEWFLPLWISMRDIQKILDSARSSSRERALEWFDYHTSTLYTLPFQAICIAQIIPQSRSLKEIAPLAREAYLAVYSGYRASSIAALVPAIEGSLTRIASDLPARASAFDKIDHAINRAIQTAAQLHFQGMWVPREYQSIDYLFTQDERVFAFETFRRWLKGFFFCNTDDYRGLTGLNRHMFAHATASSWQQPANFTRMIIALATLAAVESWYDSSHRVSFFLPEMNDDSKLLWQQALFQAEAQMGMKLIEQDRYHKHGRLVPEMPTDDGITLRAAVLSDECMSDLVRPLREAGWSVQVGEPSDEALYMRVNASQGDNQLKLALLYSCATANSIYRELDQDCDAVLYRGAPYKQDSYAYGIEAYVGPVLGWQPPRAITPKRRIFPFISEIVQRLLQ